MLAPHLPVDAVQVLLTAQHTSLQVFLMQTVLQRRLNVRDDFLAVAACPFQRCIKDLVP